MTQERDSNENNPWERSSQLQALSNWRTNQPVPPKPQINTENTSRRPNPPGSDRCAQLQSTRSREPNPASTTRPPDHRKPDAEADNNAVALAFAEGRRIYVGNLPYMAKREDVEDLFNKGDRTHPEGYYKIEKINMSVDPFTGRNPSYCFVNMEKKEVAEDAITYLNGKDVLGRPAKIKMGVPKESRPPPFGRRNPSTGDRPEPFVFDRWSRDDAADHWDHYAPSGRRVIVQGLPKIPDQQTIDYEISKLFYSFKIEAISKVINPFRLKRDRAPTLQNQYFLFVDMETAEEANKAILSLDGVGAVWGYRVTVKKYLKNDRIVSERSQWERWQRPVNDGATSRDLPE